MPTTGFRLFVACLVFSMPAGAAAQGPTSASPIASFDSAWASISRTYWDTAFINTRWRAAHDSIRNGIPAAANDDRVRVAIRALIAVPLQSHFVLIPGSAVPMPRSPDADPVTGGVPAGASDPLDGSPRGDRARPGTIGLDVRSIGDTVVAWRVQPGGPAQLAGVRPGDALTHVDTLSLDSARVLIRGAAPSGRDATDRLLATLVKARFGGRIGDTLRLTIVGSDGRARVVALTRIAMKGRYTQFGNLPPFVVTASRDSVDVSAGRPKRFAAVVAFSAWFPAIAPELDEMLFGSRDAAGLILDLRGNPGGVAGMVAGVSGHFVDSAVALGVLRARGATIRFMSNPRRVNRHGARVVPYAGPVAILVDGFTASTSEFFASGMQAIGRARVFGERSAGQALPALMARLPSGDVLMHAIADHEDAAGRRVEGDGVSPDEVVPLLRRDLREGRDAALEAARNWIARSSP